MANIIVRLYQVTRWKRTAKPGDHISSIEPAGKVWVQVEIDLDKLVGVANQAEMNQNGKATAYGGAITAQVIDPEREQRKIDRANAKVRGGNGKTIQRQMRER